MKFRANQADFEGGFRSLPLFFALCGVTKPRTLVIGEMGAKSAFSRLIPATSNLAASDQARLDSGRR
jgi:hypothetical protein